MARVGHWTPARWTAPARAVPATRADLVFSLVQSLADLAADVEAGPRRRVPRLDNDLALADQVRVMVADLGPTAPDHARSAAAASIEATLRSL